MRRDKIGGYQYGIINNEIIRTDLRYGHREHYPAAGYLRSRLKVDDAKKAQTKLEWKTTAWKDLNTKLKNLQSKYVNNMRFANPHIARE